MPVADGSSPGTRGSRHGSVYDAASHDPYSFTERKRIRKRIGKRESVLPVPRLLTMQKDSYVAFLQKDVPPARRKPEGCRRRSCPRSRSSRTTGSWR